MPTPITRSPTRRTPTPRWEWVKFWGEPDAAVAFLEKTGYFPASSVAAQGRAHRAAIRCTRPPSDTLGFGIPQPSFPGSAGWAEGTVLPAFQRVLIGQATPEQAVDEMIAGLAEAIAVNLAVGRPLSQRPPASFDSRTTPREIR